MKLLFKKTASSCMYRSCTNNIYGNYPRHLYVCISPVLELLGKNSADDDRLFKGFYFNTQPFFGSVEVKCERMPISFPRDLHWPRVEPDCVLHCRSKYGEIRKLLLPNVANVYLKFNWKRFYIKEI